MVYPFIRILFSNVKNSDTYIIWMSIKAIILSNKKKAELKSCPIRFLSFDVFLKGNSIETETKLLVAQAAGGKLEWLNLWGHGNTLLLDVVMLGH